MNETPRPAAKPQGRRVGTVTAGVTLVAAGCAMLVKLFWPDVELLWLLRLSPAILIGLGFSPLAASGLSLIANTAPVAYGGLGTPIIVLNSVTQNTRLMWPAYVCR